MFEAVSNYSSSVLLVLYFVLISATFGGCFTEASQQSSSKNGGRYGTSVVFPVQGNVYPLGYYAVLLKIGNPPKVFDFDIDTGSDLTWVQCDAPCTGCTLPQNHLYKPWNNIVPCSETLCNAINSHGKYPCHDPNDQCDYEIEYMDHGSSVGTLVFDSFPLRLTNGSGFIPRLTFGCGYDQKNPGSHPPPPTAGVLGLGNGKASILSQLHEMDVTRNMFGHCLGRQGGYLFFGEDLLPKSGVKWIPMSQNSKQSYYSSGPAELHYGGKSGGIKGLHIVFDTGSTYSYFNHQAYQAMLKLVKEELTDKPLKMEPEDDSLPVCWKGPKTFTSIDDVKKYFKPMALTFTKAKKVQFQMLPEAYIIVTKQGNVCLGILDASEAVGNINIIGDVSMQNKMMIYDNEKQQIGWFPTNCGMLPNVGGENLEGLSQTYAANVGVIEDRCPDFGAYFDN